MTRSRTAVALTGSALVAALVVPTAVVTAGPATADARVSVAGTDDKAAARTDGTTTLKVSGRGFQAIKGSAGGI